jgi:hypothetical protein
MDWFSVIGFASLMIGSFVFVLWMDPFKTDTEGVELFVEYVVWVCRIVGYVIGLGLVGWVIWMKATGQI